MTPYPARFFCRGTGEPTLWLLNQQTTEVLILQKGGDQHHTEASADLSQMGVQPNAAKGSTSKRTDHTRTHTHTHSPLGHPQLDLYVSPFRPFLVFFQARRSHAITPAPQGQPHFRQGFPDPHRDAKRQRPSQLLSAASPMCMQV